MKTGVDVYTALMLVAHEFPSMEIVVRLQNDAMSIGFPKGTDGDKAIQNFRKMLPDAYIEARQAPLS